MNRLMISAGVLALCLGSSAAFAQDQPPPPDQTQYQPPGADQPPPDQSTTTTTTNTPSETTTTRTTEGTDEYGNYRRTVTSTKRYHAAAFEAPSGFVYRRFAVGQHVPDALLGGNVIDNYRDYALITPPEGLGWIRDGQDALLVDMNTGEVIQADYDLFD